MGCGSGGSVNYFSNKIVINQNIIKKKERDLLHSRDDGAVVGKCFDGILLGELEGFAVGTLEA